MKTQQRARTIGIIGGGQLGRMLAIAAARLGFKTIILDPVVHCPAAQMANAQIVAAYDDARALDDLAIRCGVITYEFENIPVQAVENLSQQTFVAPSPRALAIAQDRLLEKQFFAQCGIPTAPWWPVDDANALLEAIKSNASQGGERGILKTRHLGYDGKGQIRLGMIDMQKAHESFCHIGNVPAIFEGFVAFEREISVIAARGSSGAVVFFDIPENHHHEGILRRSTVPARITAATTKNAHAYVTTLLDNLGYVGVIGVEFFVLDNGELLANEFAPRVHNSGHWTEAACAISQFEQHIRAITALPLAHPLRHSDCVMENLIGNDVARFDALLQEENILIHLYGKDEMKQGRKMGHFTRLLK